MIEVKNKITLDFEINKRIQYTLYAVWEYIYCFISKYEFCYHIYLYI